MAYICTTITSWITETILEPVSSWVSQQQQKCKGKWWNLFCWFITVTVQIIVWVTKEILVPFMQTVCKMVSWIPYKLASFIGIKLPFFSCVDIVLKKRTQSTVNPLDYHYVFICNCKDCSYQKEVEFDAPNDEIAAQKAKEDCKNTCK